VISACWVQMMARYNAWQNQQLIPELEAMDTGDLMRDRGVFFGSIMATANHLLWGDTLWMSRFDCQVQAPEGGITESVDLCPTASAWAADRFRLDGKMKLWSEALRAIDLKDDLTWFSGAAGRQITAPLATCVVHMFNHQTHHRGQMHAMLTAAGCSAPVSDLVFMPEDA